MIARCLFGKNWRVLRAYRFDELHCSISAIRTRTAPIFPQNEVSLEKSFRVFMAFAVDSRFSGALLVCKALSVANRFANAFFGG